MEWLSRIFDKILSLIPEVVTVDPHERAVRITGGSRYRAIGPGWYICWPVIQKVLAMEVVTQVVDLPAQTIRTGDGQDVVVSGAIRYHIRDITKALFEVQDLDKALSTLALGVILEYVQTQTLADCHNIEGVKAELRKQLAEAACGWGVRVEQVYLTDLGRVRSFRLFGDNMRIAAND